MISVLLSTDEPILAKGLESILTSSGQFRLKCVTPDLGDLLASLEADAPDVLLLDLPGEAAPGALREARQTAPNCKIVLWVTSISTELAYHAMSMGVSGILRKSLPPDLQIQCLERVKAGELWFERALTERFLNTTRVALSPREGQLVTLLSHGLKNKEIATALRLSEGTVKVYLSRLFIKVNVKDRFELALFGLKNRPAEQAPGGKVENRSPAVPSLRNIVIDRAGSSLEVGSPRFRSGAGSPNPWTQPAQSPVRTARL